MCMFMCSVMERNMKDRKILNLFCALLFATVAISGWIEVATVAEQLHSDF